MREIRPTTTAAAHLCGYRTGDIACLHAGEYARNTKFGDVIALPSFLFATSRIISGYVGGLPGIHAMWSGSDWQWHKTVQRNEHVVSQRL